MLDTFQPVFYIFGVHFNAQYLVTYYTEILFTIG